MKADCPRAFKSCTIKLASRAPGQRDTKKARTSTRGADAWVQPRRSQASQGWSAEAGKRAWQSLSWESVVPKGSPHSFGAAVTEKSNGCKGGWGRGTAQMCPQQPCAYHTALPSGKAEAVCLQELLQAGHACSAVRFCTQPLSGIQGRSTLTCSNDSLLGMFFTATRLNHMQSLVISTPTWFSLTQDLFL